MIKFDHLKIPVTDLARSRDWYIRTLGLKVEFEVPDRQTAALQDTDGFTIFLQEVRSPVMPNQCALWFQVANVDTTFTGPYATSLSASNTHTFPCLNSQFHLA